MELTLTNKDGKTLNLLFDSHFTLAKADSLHGLETDIATSDSPYLDGTQIEGVRALPRGISLTLALKPDIREAIDHICSIVKTKQYVTLTEKEGDREITIRGVVTIPPYSRMMSLCKCEIDIYCGQPYWQDSESIVADLALVVPMLFFPAETGQFFTPTGRVFSVVDTSIEKTFRNDGDVSVGMIIRMTALDSVTNPTIYCSTGEQNGDFMRLNVTLSTNDEVEICTEKGNKYIKINGSETYQGQPVLSFLEFKGNDWLQLETGDNVFNVTASPSDAIYFTISYKRRWE